MAIKMSPDELRSYAAKLTKNCQEAQALARSIDANVKSAASNWEGAAQKKYIDDFAKVKPTLEKTIPDQLSILASNLKKMADDFETLDKSYG